MDEGNAPKGNVHPAARPTATGRGRDARDAAGSSWCARGWDLEEEQRREVLAVTRGDASTVRMRRAPSTMAPPLKVVPGQTLEGRFLIVEPIGRGGMSTVFKALDLANARQVVAVKVPLPQYSSGLGSFSMFQREEQIGLELDHPFILRFLPLEPNKHRSYIVTEYVAGTTLAARIGKGRKLAEAEALRIMRLLCEAVDYLHRREIVHYDLKPGNVVLCPDGSIRLIDFGLAHVLVRARFTFAGSAPAIGTSDYVAPEQIGRQRGRLSVDIYALGSILYEMLTGHPPFEGDDPFVVASARQIGDPRAPRALNPDVSEPIEEVVLRALRRDPAERYTSVAAMKADLDDLGLVHVSGLAHRLIEVTRWRKARRVLRYITLVAVVPIAFLLASFGLLWWHLAHKR
jgi:serine/threonine protein kinase